MATNQDKTGKVGKVDQIRRLRHLRKTGQITLKQAILWYFGI